MVRLEDSASFPTRPGVYIFKNAYNEIIYIGKAKNLKKRVQSYFQRAATNWKLEALLTDATTITPLVTKNEMAALLLEAQLIQEHKPRYNVLLKNGQPFLYLKVSTQDPIPTLSIVRNKQGPGTYFGPFLKKQDARGAYTYLVNTFQLYRCNKKVQNGCLDYHLGRCAGTCLPQASLDEYLMRLNLALDVLKGDSHHYTAIIKQNIATYNKALAFEKAHHLYQYLQNLDTIFNTLKSHINPTAYDYLIRASSAPSASGDQNAALRDLHTMGLAQTIPTTIDCFDISHFQSSFMVGSCVRFTHGLPDKQKFRRFKIKTLITQDDYAALKEIIARRYRHGDFPDLIVIDGGKGQLSAAQSVVPVQQACISLAKQEETVFSAQHPDGIRLDIHTPAGKLLIALRDYTHHFAITYHRHIRAAATRTKKDA